MTPKFIHLKVHSEYSLVDGMVRLKPLCEQVADGQMPAVALTDYMNLYAMVKFYRAAQGQGIKPIFGADIRFWRQPESKESWPLTLLCQNQTGFANLTRLISLAYTDGQILGRPYVQWDWLQQYSEGLIALSGAQDGDVGQALLQQKPELAEQRLQQWQALFPQRFYLELQRVGRSDETRYIEAVLALASQAQLPVVATNPVCFLAADDFEAHEVRVAIHDGYTLADPKRPKNYTEQQHLRSEAEMVALFADIPEALTNSVEIAKRCNVSLRLGTYFLPDYPVPPGSSIERHLEDKAREGLEQRLAFLYSDDQEVPLAEWRQPYDQRLQRELDVINQMGFPGYFLIVMDFIQWAKAHDVPVGPGRGSGAGSLVAYALSITDLDPLEYDLLFERFLNPERVSMPDFDIDFCMEGRDSVIDYVAQRYGRQSVSQIITFGTMAAKAVVRDVGRVLGHPYGFVDKISKLIPFEVGMTLSKAMDQEQALQQRYDSEDEVRELLDMAFKLEGTARNVGKHAGGVVIAPSALTDFTPLYCEPESEALVTQLDKDDVESIGLVKFDFLGLRTLTIIDWAVQTINQLNPDAEPLDIAQIPLDDKASFDLLKACQTTAVFQLESRGMKDLIKRLQPDCFEDIVALVALFRPGPLGSGMVDDFIARKHGKQALAYPHPDFQHQDLQPVLQPTYGIILYQEQVMQIAQVLAGYSLGGADLLRRAMGKKKAEVMQEQRKIFLQGAEDNGVDRDLAGNIFDLVEKFAGYGFNKSHSAAYALVAYQTAWLKAHHPAAFMAAVLSSDMDNTDKVVTFLEDCKQLKLKVLPPDVNLGQYKFTVSPAGDIIYGLGAIKGAGEGAIESVIHERAAHGVFSDLFDFCRRIDLRKANKRVLEAMIRSGALDSLGPKSGDEAKHNRAALMATLDMAVKAAEQHHQTQAQGMDDLFGGPLPTENIQQSFIKVPEWEDRQRLNDERETLGLYLTGHPIDSYLPELQRFIHCRLHELRAERKKVVRFAGLVVALRISNSKRGNKMAFVTLDDRSGRFELALFDSAYEQASEVLAKDRILVVEAEISQDDQGRLRARVQSILTVDQAREKFGRQLTIKLGPAQASAEQLQGLQSALRSHKGGMPVSCVYETEQARVTFNLGEDWQVLPSDGLLSHLLHTLGRDWGQINY